MHHRFVYLLLLLAFSGCTYVEPEDPTKFITIDQFIEAVENKNAPAALELLAKDSQERLDQKVFISSDGDFDVIIKAFRQAGIMIRGKRPKDEVSTKVSNLRGTEAIIKFVMIKNDDHWKIANVLEE